MTQPLKYYYLLQVNNVPPPWIHFGGLISGLILADCLLDSANAGSRSSVRFGVSPVESASGRAEATSFAVSRSREVTTRN